MLVLKRNALIASRGMSDDEAAVLAEMTRPVVTPEQRDRLRNVSLELLMVTLASLGQQVEIVVRPARRSRSAGITVAACPRSRPGKEVCGTGISSALA
ncbi:UNVERIFIED_ORG: putative XRE-type DNA-binding protein [Burkholderia contaminans]|nr:putative XRE-type DNA-binding protein [Burkholderia contaminans]